MRAVTTSLRHNASHTDYSWLSRFSLCCFVRLLRSLRQGADSKRSVAAFDETGGVESIEIWGPDARLPMKAGQVIHFSVRRRLSGV